MAHSLDLTLEVVDETGLAGSHLGLVRLVAERALQSDGLEGGYQVSITLVDDARIRQLNAEHRGVDAPTDVLSFPLASDDTAGFVLPPATPTHLGDIVISFHRAQAQAEEYGHTLEREIAYLTAHGVLHLLGFDHEEEEDRAIMRTREEEILFDLPREE